MIIKLWLAIIKMNRYIEQYDRVLNKDHIFQQRNKYKNSGCNFGIRYKEFASQIIREFASEFVRPRGPAHQINN
jgi:hypothetical protein